MGLTVTLSGDWLGNVGNERTSTGTLAFDSSYPAGGEALSAANIGLGLIDKIEIESKSGYVFSYDYDNGKVMVYEQTDPADAGGANIPLVEVTDTTSLATLTGVKFRAVGR